MACVLLPISHPAFLFSDRYALAAEALPTLFARCLQQPVLYKVTHADVLLRTPFHALPLWLLDVRYKSAAPILGRHLVS